MVSSSQKFMTALQVLTYHEKDDYYTKDGISEKGQWFGNTSDYLGLSGEVDMKDLYALASGIRPEALSSDDFQTLKSLDKIAMDLESKYESIIKNTRKDSIERQTEMEKYLKVVNEQNKMRKEINEKIDEKDGKLVSDTVDKNTKILSHKRGGFDLTFSAPKSVSIMALPGGDKKLIDIHDETVKEVMAYAEKYFAQIRPTAEKGSPRIKVTPGNLSAALFRHYTSRTVDGQDSDPQLHTHAFIFNVVHDNEKFYSIENKEILKAIKILGQMYQNSMAFKVQKLEYAIETSLSGGNYVFDLKGVDDTVINAFSKRHLQLEDALYEHEKNSGRKLSESEAIKFRQNIVLSTRSPKKKGEDLDKLLDSWNDQLDKMGHNEETLREGRMDQISDKTIATTIEDAIKHAVVRLDSQSSTFNQHQILAETAKSFMGKMSNEEIVVEIERSLKKFTEKTDIYRIGQEYGNDRSKVYSSRDVMQAEANVIFSISHGSNKIQLMNKDIYEDLRLKTEKKLINEAKLQGKTHYTLTDGQEAAMAHIVTSSEQIIAIQGDAGTGKTTMLKNLAGVVEQLREIMGDKIEIEGFAATGIAKSEIQKSGGFSAMTIDSYLRKPIKEASPDVQKLFIVDEASMLSTRKMEEFITKALKQNAKIVFIGDSKQLKAIEEGDLFSKLQPSQEMNDEPRVQYQMNTVVMSQSIRQKNDFNKEIAESFKTKETYRNGLLKLQAAGHVISAIEKEDGIIIRNIGMDHVRDEFVKNVVDDYKKYGLSGGENSVIALTTKNSERLEFNKRIRSELQAAGVVDTKNVTVQTLESLSLNKTDQKFAGNYSVGDVMIAKKMNGDIKSKQQVTVLDVNKADNSIKISYDVFDKKTSSILIKEKWISATTGNSYDAYRQVETDFSIGDKIGFTKNGKIGGLEVSNGETGIIKDIDKNGNFLITRGDEEITLNPKEYRDLTHAYVITTHKSQGQTARYAHVFADAENGLLNLNAGYVQLSRSEDLTRIYTDSIDDLINRYALEQKPFDVIDYMSAESLQSFSGNRILDRLETKSEISDRAKDAFHQAEDDRERIPLKTKMVQADGEKAAARLDKLTNKLLENKEINIEALGEIARDVAGYRDERGNEADIALFNAEKHHAHATELAFGGSRSMSFDEDEKRLSFNRQDMVRWKMSRSDLATQKLSVYFNDKIIEKGSASPQAEMEFAISMRIKDAEREAEDKGKILSSEKIESIRENATKMLTPAKELKEKYLDSLVVDGHLIKNGAGYSIGSDRKSVQEYRETDDFIKDIKTAVKNQYGHIDNKSILIETKSEISDRIVDRAKDAFHQAEDDRERIPLKTKMVQADGEKAAARLDKLTNKLLENKEIDLDSIKASTYEFIKKSALEKGGIDEMVAELIATKAADKIEKTQGRFLDSLSEKGIVEKSEGKYRIVEKKHQALAEYRTTKESLDIRREIARDVVGYRDERSESVDKQTIQQAEDRAHGEKWGYQKAHDLMLSKTDEQLLSNRTISISSKMKWLNENIEKKDSELYENMRDDINRTHKYLEFLQSKGFVSSKDNDNYEIKLGSHIAFAEYRQSEIGKVLKDSLLNGVRLDDEKFIDAAKKNIEKISEKIENLSKNIMLKNEGKDYKFNATDALNPTAERHYQMLLKSEAKIMINKEYDFSWKHELKFENEDQKNAFNAYENRLKERFDKMVDDNILSKSADGERYKLTVSRKVYDEYINSRTAIQDRSNLAKTDWNKTYMDDYQFEIKAMVDAKRDQEIIDNRIAKMRTESKDLADRASGHFDASKLYGQKYQSKSAHFIEGARAGQKSEEIKIGIRYQQLSKLDAKIVEIGHLDLSKERDFFVKNAENDLKNAEYKLKIHGENKSKKDELLKEHNLKMKAYLTNQARQTEYLDKLVAAGLLSKDENNDKYSLATSRRNFLEFQNTTKASNIKYDVAQNAWDKSLADNLFRLAKSKTDTMLISGASWDMKEATARLKKEGLFTKETEEIFDRLEKRYKGLAKIGLVQKSSHGYSATDPEKFKNFIGSENEKKLSEKYEKNNVKDWRTAKERSLSSQLDKAILKKTKVNFKSFTRDIKDTYWGTKHFLGERSVMAEVISSVVAVTLGTTKTITRGTFGTVYRAAKILFKKSSATNQLSRTIENDIERRDQMFNLLTERKVFSDQLKDLHPEKNLNREEKSKFQQKLQAIPNENVHKKDRKSYRDV